MIIANLLPLKPPFHREGELLPASRFCVKSPPAGGGDGVHASPTIILGRGHLRPNVTVGLQAVKRGIERSLTRVQAFLRHLANPVRNPPAMVGPKRQNPKDQQVEGALQQVGLGHRLLSKVERSVTHNLSEVKRSCAATVMRGWFVSERACDHHKRHHGLPWNVAATGMANGVSSFRLLWCDVRDGASNLATTIIVCNDRWLALSSVSLGDSVAPDSRRLGVQRLAARVLLWSGCRRILTSLATNAAVSIWRRPGRVPTHFSTTRE